jgi:hypothetical protein
MFVRLQKQASVSGRPFDFPTTISGNFRDGDRDSYSFLSLPAVLPSASLAAMSFCICAS